MAATATQYSQNFRSINNNLKYDPLIAGHKSKSTANFPSSSNFSARLIKSTASQLITANSINKIIGSTNYRRLPAITCSSSSEKITQTSTPPDTLMSSGIVQQFRHHFSLRMIIEIITFIWQLPSIITKFLKKEEKFLDTVEEDITEAATVIQGATKVVEEVAECLEKVAKTVENDAERVDAIMDEVKGKTKVAHDELEEAIGSLEGSMQDAGTSVTKLKAQVKISKEEATNTLTTTIPPPPSTPTSSYVRNANLLHYNPFQDLNQVQGFYLESLQTLLGVLGSIQLFLPHINFEPLSSLSSLPKAFIGTLFMFSLCYLLGFGTTNPLIL